MKPIAHRAPQAGFSLLFTLIALVVLLVASVAIMRSSGMSLMSSGNTAFKQDMLAQSEDVNARIYALFRPGGSLGSNSTLAASSSTLNYSARALATNDQGIPEALIDDTLFATHASASNDIAFSDANIKIRYIIERLCDATGDAIALGRSRCVHAPEDKPMTGGSSTGADTAMPPNFSPIYRVSMRIQGPRGAETYVQSSFLKPN